MTRSAKFDDLVALGAKAGVSNKDVASQSDVIITMLPNSPHVKEAVLGKDGVLEGAKAGTILVDMSSIAPGAAQEICAAVKEKGIVMLDAPVSGGEPKAIEGTLAVMVGGEAKAFETVKPILEKMGFLRCSCRRNRCRECHQAGQPDHRCAQHCGSIRSLRAGHQGRRQSGIRVQRHQGWARRLDGDERQGADDTGRQLQARLPHRTAHQGSAERSWIPRTPSTCRYRSRPTSWRRCRLSRTTTMAPMTTALSSVTTRNWPRLKSEDDHEDRTCLGLKPVRGTPDQVLS